MMEAALVAISGKAAHDLARTDRFTDKLASSHNCRTELISKEGGLTMDRNPNRRWNPQPNDPPILHIQMAIQKP